MGHCKSGSSMGMDMAERDMQHQGKPWEQPRAPSPWRRGFHKFQNSRNYGINLLPLLVVIKGGGDE